MKFSKWVSLPLAISTHCNCCHHQIASIFIAANIFCSLPNLWKAHFQVKAKSVEYFIGNNTNTISRLSKQTHNKSNGKNTGEKKLCTIQTSCQQTCFWLPQTSWMDDDNEQLNCNLMVGVWGSVFWANKIITMRPLSVFKFNFGIINLISFLIKRKSSLRSMLAQVIFGHLTKSRGN